MTSYEFYEAISKLGKYATVGAHVKYVDGKFSHCFISLCVDDIAIDGARSYEEALDKFAALDKDKAKADKLARLKAQIQELEAS